MKIQNNGKQFELTFDGKDVFVPEGLSGEFPDDVAYHIQFVAQKWNKDVKLISNLEEEAKAKVELEAKDKKEIPDKKPKETKPSKK